MQVPKKMKILWLSHVLPYPPKAGVLLRSYHLLRGLSKGNEVDLLAFNQPALMRSFTPDAEEGKVDAIKKLSDFCTIKGVYSIPSDASAWFRRWNLLMGIFRRKGYTINWLLSGEFASAVLETMRCDRYDIVHMDTLSFLPYLELVESVPVVLDHHNIESHMMFRRAEQEVNLLKRAYFVREARKLHKWEQFYCSKVSHNITCSDIDSQRLREIAPQAAVSTVPNAVDCEYFSPRRTKVTKNEVIFVGTMSWYPNVQAVEYLIREVWPQLLSRFPDLHLNIVGGGAPESLVQLGKAAKQVTFHGFVDDIRAHINSSAAFLCPISDGGGTKLKVLDALSMAIPLVAHPVACEGIAVTHGRDVLFAQSPEDYVQALAMLLGDSDFAERLGNEGRDLVMNTYSSARVGETMRALYAGLCD